MKESMMKFKDKATTFWTNRSNVQKGVFISSTAIVLMLIIGLSFFTSNTKFIPLYNDLSLNEVGQIKEELDTRGVPYEIDDGGTTIKVSDENVDALLVDLAGQGIPTSGNIDYSFFSDNASWGITENEFNIMKLDAMQTELANLMKSIEGISEAKVMINMPEESVFVSEEAEEASASIVLDTEPGYQFKGNQMESLYHLVSKAVPNLPQDNIVIMNQYFEYFDKNSEGAYGNLDNYTYQQSIKNDIEQDIQRRLQQMLGAMVGTESVIVSVTADVDFTRENRVEELIEPVDLENMEGLPVSIETVHETYSGNPAVGGVAGTGEEDIAGYQAEVDGDDGEYELVKETINNEFNHIRKDIVESPYKVRDLGIQVAVDNVMEDDGNEIQYLSQTDQNNVETGITSILNSIIGTSIDKDYGEIVPEEKISIVFQEFSQKTPLQKSNPPTIPFWVYVSGAILLLLIIILVIILIRNRKNASEEIFEEELITETSTEIPTMESNPETEADIKKKQMEKMAEDNPEEFAKLLRGWISED